MANYTDYKVAVPGFANQGDMYLLETEIKFSEQNLANTDTVDIMDCQGLHILKVMYDLSITEAVTMKLGDSDDDDGWSNGADITGSTSVRVAGISTTEYGVGKSFLAGTEKLMQLTAGGTLETGSMKVKVLAVKL